MTELVLVTAALEVELVVPELDEELPEDVEPLEEVDPLELEELEPEPVEPEPLEPELLVPEPLAVLDPELDAVPLPDPDPLVPEDVLLPVEFPELVVEPEAEAPPADLAGELDALGAAALPEAELLPEAEVPLPVGVAPPPALPAGVAPPPVLPPEVGIAVNPSEVCAVAPTAKATPRTPRLATVTTLLVRFLTRQTPRRGFGAPGFRRG